MSPGNWMPTSPERSGSMLKMNRPRPLRVSDATLLTDGEQRLTLSTPEHSRPQLRAQLWTRKEALLKALGTGLAREPNGIDVVADPRVRSMAPEPLGLPSNLVVAVAWLALPPRR